MNTVTIVMYFILLKMCYTKSTLEIRSAMPEEVRFFVTTDIGLIWGRLGPN